MTGSTVRDAGVSRATDSDACCGVGAVALANTPSAAGVAELRWRRADVLWRQALGEVVVLAVDGSEPLALTPPGADVWALLAEPISEAGLVEALASGYHADPNVVAGDLRPVLKRLADAGAITQV